LHGHVQREMNDLETSTNSLLRRKTDVGAFVRGENAYAIAKCSFRDHPEKPENVSEVKLSLNILDTELISPIFPYHEAMTSLLKDMISKRITDALEKEIDELNEKLVDEGKDELTGEEKIFERIKALDHWVSDEEQESSKRYTLLPKKFFDAIEGLSAEIASAEFDPLGVRENVFKILTDENIRNRGFNTAVNSLTHVLDWSRMGYQHIENYKTLRKCVIREYEDTDPEILPDERYQIDLSYYTAAQIRNLREAYMVQTHEFQDAVMELWDVVETVYDEARNQPGREDWEVFSERLLNRGQKKGASWFTRLFQDSDEEEELAEEVTEKQWNEVNFVAPEETDVTTDYPTMEFKNKDIKNRFPIMRERIKYVFESNEPEVREVIEGRINFLENEFNKFSSLVNPFHLQPGVLLDVDICSIKRKSTTMMNMGNVLNEFLSSMSKGFQDAAFAGFSRRRSTRSDDDGQFSSDVGMAELVASEQGEEVFD